jgi:hypothetical protein
MKAAVPLLAVAVAVAAVVAARAVVAIPPDDTGPWSDPVRGLQARVTVVQKAKSNGTRSLVAYLELRNVSSSAHPLKVRCGEGHVRFELVDADGNVVRDGWSQPRSGPHADPGTVSLPLDSWMRISMYCSNWGVPRDAAAMISTDSGAWVLRPEEKGKVFLRATLKGTPDAVDPDRTWHGTVALPPVRVDWSK